MCYRTAGQDAICVAGGTACPPPDVIGTTCDNTTCSPGKRCLEAVYNRQRHVECVDPKTSTLAFCSDSLDAMVSPPPALTGISCTGTAAVSTGDGGTIQCVASYNIQMPCVWHGAEYLVTDCSVCSP